MNICESETMCRTAHGERELWQAVLLLALMDASADARYTTENRNATRDAKRWIEYAGHDFREVCFLAGFDPDAVREAYFAGRIKANIHTGQGAGVHRPAQAPNRGPTDTGVEGRILKVVNKAPMPAAVVADYADTSADLARNILRRLETQGKVRCIKRERSLFWVRA